MKAKSWRALGGILTVVGIAGASAAWIWLDRTGLEVQHPVEAARVGLGGVEVLVAFAPERAAAPTFRAMLNGADVTRRFEIGRNGAHGRLHELLPGTNELAFEIFTRLPGELPWLVELRTVRLVEFRPPVGMDQG